MSARLACYLGLARASNLPTVWSNALAAWALVGAAWDLSAVLWLAAAGSLLYAGGCTLNDAFDAAWDRAHRPERPIPSGKLSAREVWLVGAGELLAGLAMLGRFGLAALGSGLLVLVAILLYDWLHKRTPWAVLLMGWCRFQWGCTAALAAGGLVQEPRFLAYALYLFGYIVFVSLTARKESQPRASGMAGYRRNYFRAILLAAPLLLMLSRSAAPWSAVVAGAAFLGWFRWTQFRALGAEPPQIGRFVGWALAGITLLDTVFACLHWDWQALGMWALLPLCLLLQRRIAAT